MLNQKKLRELTAGKGRVVFQTGRFYCCRFPAVELMEVRRNETYSPLKSHSKTHFQEPTRIPYKDSRENVRDANSRKGRF